MDVLVMLPRLEQTDCGSVKLPKGTHLPGPTLILSVPGNSAQKCSNTGGALARDTTPGSRLGIKRSSDFSDWSSKCMEHGSRFMAAFMDLDDKDDRPDSATIVSLLSVVMSCFIQLTLASS
jgi:hypothetical protein